jgi:hypothetical protein
MTCKIVTTNGAVFAAWGVPEAADLDRVLAAIAAAARENGGPVVYITRVPADAPPPAGEARKQFDRVLPLILPHCASFHVVLEGTGFVSAFKRGILTNLLQPFWRKSVYFVHSRCEDALDDLDNEKQIAAVLALLRLAAQNGLTSGPVTDSMSPAALEV